jgi:hypothetical protein
MLAASHNVLGIVLFLIVFFVIFGGGFVALNRVANRLRPPKRDRQSPH